MREEEDENEGEEAREYKEGAGRMEARAMRACTLAQEANCFRINLQGLQGGKLVCLLASYLPSFAL